MPLNFRRKDCWISLSLWISPLVMGVQSTDEYSRIGRTRDLNRVSIVVGSRVLKVLRIHEDILFADSMMLLMCSLKVQSDDSVTPRSLTVFFASITLNDGEI